MKVKNQYGLAALVLAVLSSFLYNFAWHFKSWTTTMVAVFTTVLMLVCVTYAFGKPPGKEESP